MLIKFLKPRCPVYLRAFSPQFHTLLSLCVYNETCISSGKIKRNLPCSKRLLRVVSPFPWPPACILSNTVHISNGTTGQVQQMTIMYAIHRDVRSGLALGLGSPLRMMSCHHASSYFVIDISLQTCKSEWLQSFYKAELTFCKNVVSDTGYTENVTL